MDTPRFQAALAYANHIHAGQFRKGTSIPYFAHLLAVTAIVLEQGGSEDEAIGALLHDAAEDAGGLEGQRTYPLFGLSGLRAQSVPAAARHRDPVPCRQRHRAGRQTIFATARTTVGRSRKGTRWESTTPSKSKEQQ